MTKTKKENAKQESVQSGRKVLVKLTRDPSSGLFTVWVRNGAAWEPVGTYTEKTLIRQGVLMSDVDEGGMEDE